ncbi:MAG: hypothetical protein ONB25_12565 [candidate division KSB1 bacterium]|nr:hypothetical protein [candidate division KSB1 bacterium]
MKGLVGPFVLLLASSVSAIARQTCSGDSVLFPGEHRYKKAMIYLDDSDNTLIEAKSLVIRDDTLFVTKTPTYAGERPPKVCYPLNSIYMIKVSKGSKAGSFAAVGAAMGFLSGLINVDSFHRGEPYVKVNPEVEAAFLIGFTAVGAIIGAGFGSKTHDWEIIYIKGRIGPSAK